MNDKKQEITNNSKLKNHSSWADLQALGIEIEWAWYKWLPKGFVTLLVGDVGIGKSTMALRMGASFLAGMDWLDGTEFTEEPGCIVWCEAESGHFMNLDRAQRWGLPTDKILSPLDDISDDFNLSSVEHREALEQIASQDDVRLIIIDSLRGAIEGDENKSEFMKQLKYLGNLAQKHQLPILLTHHLRKKGKFDTSGQITIDRIRGTSAIAQIPRVVITISIPNSDFPDKRKLHVIKSNLGKYPESIGISITDHGIETVGDIDQYANKQNVTQRDRAKDYLREYLKDGYKPSKMIYQKGKEKGLDQQTLKRAKDDLGIIVRRQGPGWVWEFPPNEEPIKNKTLFESSGG